MPGITRQRPSLPRLRDTTCRPVLSFLWARWSRAKTYPRSSAPTAVCGGKKDLTRPWFWWGDKGWIYDEICATIAALGLDDDVRHLSGIFDEELAHFYHGASLLATPSFYEGFGLPALEAMHCGCPVVVSRRGSLPEIVGSAGLLVDDPKDEAAWAEVLFRVLSDSRLRGEMVENGRLRARTFNWRKTAAATLKLYNDV